jgi:hypothetical protein
MHSVAVRQGLDRTDTLDLLILSHSLMFLLLL